MSHEIKDEEKQGELRTMRIQSELVFSLSPCSPCNGICFYLVILFFMSSTLYCTHIVDLGSCFVLRLLKMRPLLSL